MTNIQKTVENHKNMVKACEKILGSKKLFRVYKKENHGILKGYQIHYIMIKKNGNARLSRRRTVVEVA